MDPLRRIWLRCAHNMTPTARLCERISELESALADIQKSVAPIQGRVPGWSGVFHYLFFKALLDTRPELKTILILGVYMGRDISFMCDAAKTRPLQIVGVDKFSDTPCADWPEDKRSLSWKQAGFGEAPNAEKAYLNINPAAQHSVRLIEADDVLWLQTIEGKFDFIFLDTAHDAQTVIRQINHAKKLCHENTIIAGDDYENLLPTWGVKDAVKEAFLTHQVLADTIWFADAGELK